MNGGSGGGANSQHSTSMSDDSVYDMDNSDANTTTDSLNLTDDRSINSPSRLGGGGEETSGGKKTLHESSESEMERRERKKQRKERKRLEKLARKQALLSANIISGTAIFCIYEEAKLLFNSKCDFLSF